MSRSGEGRTRDVGGDLLRQAPERSAPLPGLLEERWDSGAIPHVVAWNLTRRCNLACSHCYISAGSWQAADAELDTETCLGILDQVLAVNPAPLLILSGGEPLVREDLEEIAGHASDAGATVVVGTNGTGLSRARIASLKAAGVTGVAVSVDSLRPTYHDRFRHGAGALSDTLSAVDRLGDQELDVVVQTTLTRGNRDEVAELAAWAADKGAVSFNLYFLVPTGRGERMEGLSPEENEVVLGELVELEARYRGRMMVRSKCQPQLMRHVMQAGGTDSPLLRYRTRCPCGVHYCRITPEGKVTPCPYLPAVAGDLARTSFREIWEEAPLFQALRQGELGGRCGRCAYREVCGGCRARAYARTGDPLAEDACAYQPRGREEPVVRPATVTYGQTAEVQMAWTEPARARLARIPSFVRGVVTTRVETFARERGYGAVDLEVMAEVRRSLPVDFSKRLPFFLRGQDRGEGDGDA